MKKYNIFIFPHAGASANSYLGLKEIFKNNNFESFIYEYKGHGSRYCEKFSNSVEEVAKDFIDKYSNLLNEDFIFLGHSYGTNVIYEICCQLNKNNKKLPAKVYLSSGAILRPTIDETSNGIMNLLKKQAMTDSAVLSSEELFKFFYPIIKSDISNLNRYKPELYYLPIKATLFHGDKESIDCFDNWYKLFKIETVIKLQGGHEYILQNDNQKKIIDLIRKDESLL